MGAGSYRRTLYGCGLPYNAMLHRSDRAYDDVYNNYIFLCRPPGALWQGGAQMIAKILDLFAACFMPGGVITYGATVAGLILIALFWGLIDGGYND